VGTLRMVFRNTRSSGLGEGIAGLIDRRKGGNRDRFTERQISELATRLRTHTPVDLFGEMAATADGQF
jgi:hypothetical protein